MFFLPKDNNYQPKCRFFLTGLLLLCLSPLSFSGETSIEQQRQIFHEASRALALNQASKFKRLLTQIADYPAQPYLVYDALRRHIGLASNKKITKFLDAYKDYPFAYHVRGKWLSTLAKRKDWKSYLAFFDDRDNTKYQCLALKARLTLGLTEGINDDIKKFWFRGYSQPDECDAAFKYFLATYPKATEAIWTRIEKAFQARRPKLARYLGKSLKKSDRDIVDLWYHAHRRPEQSLKSLINSADDAQNRTIIVHAIDRLARRDSLKARKVWDDIKTNFKFTQAQQNKLTQRIALSSAYQHQSVAEDLLTNLSPELKDEHAFLWLARIQLRDQNWSGLANTITEMPSNLREEEEWQYWYARALELQGLKAESRKIFQSVAKFSNYYGFLAADRINTGYYIEQESVTAANFDKDAFLSDNPPMLRARELFFLKRNVDARREWYQAIKKLDTIQIKQAAKLASSWKWHDSAIRTVAKTPHRRDYEMRFPMPYKKQVMSHAVNRKLDPSVIYGVMRRESLFDPLARSSAGALGLMQLMPATAKHVARSLGIKKINRSAILKIENNINFGTKYFRTVMNRFDNNVSLAAAAYNAGPGNVKKWLPRKTSLPADLWVETIPFNETRKYVQAVLAYASVFDKSLGKGTLISSRMDDIRVKY